MTGDNTRECYHTKTTLSGQLLGHRHNVPLPGVSAPSIIITDDSLNRTKVFNSDANFKQTAVHPGHIRPSRNTSTPIRSNKRRSDRSSNFGDSHDVGKVCCCLRS